MFIYSWERAREKEYTCVSWEGQRERETEELKQAVLLAPCGAQLMNLSWSQMLNWLSHPVPPDLNF